MSLRQRVFIYITNHGKLLVFDHVENPSLGMQIPGGTIEEGELPAHAALREAEEETGLSEIKLKSFLGEFQKDLTPFGRDETIHAWFFHLEATGQPPIRWRHYETDAHNKVEPIEFELYWVALDPKPVLGGIDDAKLYQLMESLCCNTKSVGD